MIFVRALVSSHNATGRIIRNHIYLLIEKSVNTAGTLYRIDNGRVFPRDNFENVMYTKKQVKDKVTTPHSFDEHSYGYGTITYICYLHGTAYVEYRDHLMQDGELLGEWISINFLFDPVLRIKEVLTTGIKMYTTNDWNQLQADLEEANTRRKNKVSKHTNKEGTER